MPACFFCNSTSHNHFDTADLAQHLKPGGQMVACSFSEASFTPNADLFLARIERYGVGVPPLSWKRLGDEALNHNLQSSAGLEDIRVLPRDLSHSLADAEAWRDVLWYACFRGLLNQLTEPDLARFRAEHLAEIAEMSDGRGIPQQLKVLYARERKPG